MRHSGPIHAIRFSSGGLRSRRGSASALIVLMVVLLAVFGAMALASAAANLRLARRHADWSKEYYTFDAAAERLLAAVDTMAEECSAGGQNAAALATRLAGLRLDGIDSVEAAVSDGRLVVDAVAGDPEQRGILVSIAVPVDGAGSVLAGDPVVLRWSQFQKPFEYGTGPGGLWDGSR